MDFLELAKNRYSCRKFSDTKVEREKILSILEAGRVSPSAHNLCPTKVLVLETEDNINKLKLATKCTFDAKTILVVMYDKDTSWKRSNDQMDEGIVDASICATHMMLEIENLNLGTTWVGSFDKNIIMNEFNLPNNMEVVCLLPVGYKADDSSPLPLHFKRKELNEFASFDKE